MEARHFAHCTTPQSNWLEGNFGIPKLEDLEFVDLSNLPSRPLLNGGEDEALGHFKNFVKQVCSNNSVTVTTCHMICLHVI